MGFRFQLRFCSPRFLNRSPIEAELEWVSGSSSASIGDLFKNLGLQLGDAEEAEAPAEEEAPKKKATRKKKADEAPVEE